jgi:Zn-dependent protease with chaperone function
MQDIKAIYFDGSSSIAQSIDFVLDEKNAIFIFGSPELGIIKQSILEAKISNHSGLFIIEFGTSPIQTIKIDDAEYIKYLKNYLSTNGIQTWYQKLINLGVKVHLLIALSILGLIAGSYFFVLPFVAEQAVVLVPKSYDDKMGEEFYQHFVEYNVIDSAKTKQLEEFAQKLQFNNSQKLHFTVVKSDIVNAFALPDGHIIVFTGLLDLMQNYEELVALLGHEATHVNERHSVKMLCRNIAGYLLISAILSDANGVIATIADNANGIYSLTFSRGFEREADLKGFEIMKMNKVNPNGMSNLFLRLKEGNKIDIEIPEFLSSHPVTDARIEYVNETIKSNTYNYQTNLELKKIFEVIKKTTSLE